MFRMSLRKKSAKSRLGEEAVRFVSGKLIKVAMIFKGPQISGSASLYVLGLLMLSCLVFV